MTAHTLKDLLQTSGWDTIPAGMLVGATTFVSNNTPSDTNGSLGLAATPPFAVVVEPGTATEESMLVTGVVAGTKTFTVTRDLSGTGAYAHAANAVVRMYLTQRTIADLVATLITNPMTTVGDVIVGGTVTGGVAAPDRLAAGTSAYVLTSNGAGAAPSWQVAPGGGGGGGGALAYVRACDQQTSGTNGGSFTSGSWVTRALNTKADDTGSIASVTSNQITLPAGTYEVRASAPGHSVGSHMIRLQDITNAATILTGTSEFSSAAGGYAQTRAPLSGIVVLAGTTVLEVQHRCSNTNSAAFGRGVATSLGTETYTVAEFWKRA